MSAGSTNNPRKVPTLPDDPRTHGTIYADDIICRFYLPEKGEEYAYPN